MIGILNIGGLIFVKDGEASDKYIETYRAEADLRSFRIKVDRTLNPPYYELFEEWKEGGRAMHKCLFATSSLSKMLNRRII